MKLKPHFKRLAVSAAVIAAFAAYKEAHSMDFSASIGQSQTQRPGNGVWYQEGYPHDQQLNSNSFRVAVSERLSRNLKVELDYTNFGMIAGSYFAVSDENYSSGGSTTTGNPPCRQPCEAVRPGSLTAKAQGVGLSLMPEYHFSSRWVGFARIGAVYYHAKTDVRNANFQSNQLPDPNPQLGNYRMKRNGISPYYGLGIGYNVTKTAMVSAEYAQAPKINSTEDGFQNGVKDLRFSLTWKF